MNPLIVFLLLLGLHVGIILNIIWTVIFITKGYYFMAVFATLGVLLNLWFSWKIQKKAIDKNE